MKFSKARIANTIIGGFAIFLLMRAVAHGGETQWGEWPIWSALVGALIFGATCSYAVFLGQQERDKDGGVPW